MMTQIEISKERMKLENEFQELLKEKKELERSLHCTNNAIEKNRTYERLLVEDADEYLRDRNFWETVQNNVATWLSRNEKLMRV